MLASVCVAPYPYVSLILACRQDKEKEDRDDAKAARQKTRKKGREEYPEEQKEKKKRRRRKGKAPYDSGSLSPWDNPEEGGKVQRLALD